MAAPPYQPLSNTHTQTKGREVPQGTPTGSSPSFNCLTLSCLKSVEKGRETEPAEHMHSWSLLHTRQEHLGSQ